MARRRLPNAEQLELFAFGGEEAVPSVPAPQETIAYHVGRAAEGLATAYTAALTQPELVDMAMSEKLPDHWSPIEPRWEDPTWLPAGAFGENAGPT